MAAEPGDLMGSLYEYDLTFDVDVIPRRPPGEALGKGGGGPGVAYVALQTARREGDLDTVILHQAAYRAEYLAELEDEYRADQIDYMKEDAYQAMKVLGGALYDGFAILEVEGTDAYGSEVKGQVKMVLDGDNWRLEVDDVM